MTDDKKRSPYDQSQQDDSNMGDLGEKGGETFSEEDMAEEDVTTESEDMPETPQEDVTTDDEDTKRDTE